MSATLEELQEFCNSVRKAGGANPLEALLPGVPEDTRACLIANNLNFHCEVNCGFERDTDLRDRWGMFFHDTPENRELVDRIAADLDLQQWAGRTNLQNVGREGRRNHRAVGLVLPIEIGDVAADYDAWWVNDSGYDETDWMTHPFAALVDPDERDRRGDNLFSNDD